MPKQSSPLRYPGGKGSMLPLATQLIRLNNWRGGEYAEPYAGGAGLALNLLYSGNVNELHLNDIDPSIWSFWSAILDHTEDFIELMHTTPVTLDEWANQKTIQSEQLTTDIVKLGFAAFFLNRVNRSGIIRGAGVIGGKEQNGNYLMDCRFNKSGLEHRIRRIIRYRSRINLTNLDAIDFMKEMGKFPESIFLCIDPPYFNKGKKLYTSFYRPEDHAAVAQQVSELENPWIVTYDNTPEIRRLYQNYRQFEFDINYSLQTKRVGTEILIASKGLRVTPDLRENLIKHRRSAA